MTPTESFSEASTVPRHPHASSPGGDLFPLVKGVFGGGGVVWWSSAIIRFTLYIMCGSLGKGGWWEIFACFSFSLLGGRDILCAVKSVVVENYIILYHPRDVDLYFWCFLVSNVNPHPNNASTSRTAIPKTPTHLKPRVLALNPPVSASELTSSRSGSDLLVVPAFPSSPSRITSWPLPS